MVEALVAGEAAGPAHSTLDRLEAGRALAAAVSASVGDKLRAAFPLPVTPDSPGCWLVRRRFSPTGSPSPRRSHPPPTDGRRAGRGAEASTADAAGARADLTAFARWSASPSAPGRTAGFPSGSNGGSSWPSRAPCMSAPGHARKGRLARLRRRPGRAIRSAPPRPAAHASRPRSSSPAQPRDRFWEFEEATLALSRLDAATTTSPAWRSSSSARSTATTGSRSRSRSRTGRCRPLRSRVRDTFGTHESSRRRRTPNGRCTGRAVISGRRRWPCRP